jgi:hypothetical protein
LWCAPTNPRRRGCPQSSWSPTARAWRIPFKAGRLVRGSGYDDLVSTIKDQVATRDDRTLTLPVDSVLLMIGNTTELLDALKRSQRDITLVSSADSNARLTLFFARLNFTFTTENGRRDRTGRLLGGVAPQSNPPGRWKALRGAFVETVWVTESFDRNRELRPTFYLPDMVRDAKQPSSEGEIDV